MLCSVGRSAAAKKTVVLDLIKLLSSGLMDIIIYYQYTVMSLQQETEEGHRRRGREGRWTPAEADLFEELIQKYGKNWKKIQSFIRGRSLSQIRSHAQKYFRKVGEGRVREFERKAKLLEALDTLEKEKLRMAAGVITDFHHRKMTEEESSLEEASNQAISGRSGSQEEEAKRELRNDDFRDIKEQLSLAPNNDSQALPAQTPAVEFNNPIYFNEYPQQPYMPLHPAFSYFILAPPPQTYLTGYNYTSHP